MNESFLKRVARSALFVACLALALMLSACSLSPAGTGNAPSDTTPCTVKIKVDCGRNFITGHYSVDASVDSGKLGSVEANNKVTFEAKLTKGQHELALKKAGSEQPEGKVSFVVENEGDRFSYHVKLASDKIEVEPIEEAPEHQAVDSQVVFYGRCSLEVPSSWEVTDAIDGKYAYPEYGGTVYLRSSEISLDGYPADSAYEDILTGVENDGRCTITSEVEKLKVGDADAFRNGMEFRLDAKNYIGAMESIITEDECYTVQFAVPETVYSTYTSDVTTVLDSIRLDEPHAQAPEGGSP